MSQEGIALTLREGAALISIDRPALKNALDRAAWAELARVVSEACRSEARVIVVEGKGGSFCAGGDLKTIESRLALPFPERRAQLTEDAQVIRALVECGRPTLAVIDGPAMGAGLALALACDVRIASARSRLSAAFCKVGLAGDFGISWLLPRAVGRGRALDLLYTGRMLGADEAKAIGLVERVLPDEELGKERDRYLAQLATGPSSLSIIRRVVDEVAGLPLAEALPAEAAGQAEASRSEDAREGARAFLEKRPPRFHGR